MDWTQVMAIVVPVLLAVILGIIYNNRRIDDLRSDMNQRFGEINQRFVDINQRFADLMQTMNNRFEDMNQRFTDTNQRISDLKSDVNEIRHLLFDLVRREYDIQKVAEG